MNKIPNIITITALGSNKKVQSDLKRREKIFRNLNNCRKKPVMNKECNES